MDDTFGDIRQGGTRHVFLGDLIYNHMHGYFRDGHAFNWLKALDRLAQEFNHTDVFHPAHGEACSIEMISWQRGYIQAFLNTLHSMLGERDALSEEEKTLLVARMQSYLPNDKLVPLLKYEMDETVRLLAGQLRG